MGRTVRELGETLGADELIEWMAFERLEPWGSEIDAYRIGLICSTVANAFRGKKGRRFKPTDFMPKSRGPALNGEQLWAKIGAGMAAIGAANESLKRR